jgi:hypothetical protein
MDTPKEGFASRWSRLKREPEAETPATDEHGTAKALAEPDPAQEPGEKPLSELTDAELLEKFALPDPDTMKAGDNFSAFMNQAIPDRLRRRALRVLWGSNPVLANLDELVDYGEDYTDAATVIENMQTIYQVGKGSAWKFQEEQARIAEAKAALDAEEAERRAHNDDPQDHEPAEEEIALAEAAPADDLTDQEPEPVPEQQLAALEEEIPETAPPLRPRPRAMRFEFE